jgi:replicative DNA helicase
VSQELYDHPTEREAIAILADTSTLNVDRAKALIEQHPLDAGEFHLPAHAELYQVSVALLRESRPVDLVSVSAAAKGNPKLPPKLIGEVLTRVAGGEGAFPGHARTLRELALKRRALASLDELRGELVRPGADIESVLSKGAGIWAGFTTGRRGYRRGNEVAMELLDQLDQAQQGTHSLCLPSGIDVWDDVFGGVECGTLNFIGSQPSVGKSALLATFVDNWDRAGIVSGIFSLEDKATWLPRRHFAKASGVPNRILAKKPLIAWQKERVASAVDELGPLSMHHYIDDRPLLTAAQVEQTARDMIVNKGCKVIVVDHLGKLDLEAHKFHRHDLAIEHALQRFTAVAKTYNVPFVIACHLKSDDNGKQDFRYRRPNLQDFALAAWISRDARVAAGLYFTREDPDVLMVAALKQTNGEMDLDFPIRKLKEAAMLCSVNGRLEGTEQLSLPEEPNAA